MAAVVFPHTSISPPSFFIMALFVGLIRVFSALVISLFIFPPEGERPKSIMDNSEANTKRIRRRFAFGEGEISF